MRKIGYEIMGKPIAMIPGGGWRTVHGSDGELRTRDVIAWVLFVDEDGYFEVKPITSDITGIIDTEEIGDGSYSGILAPSQILENYRDYFNKACKEYDQKKAQWMENQKKEALAAKTGV